MDSNNWRPNQGTNPTMDTSDWRAQLPIDSRQRIVNKIMETLKKHLPVSGPDGLHELRKIAQRFEDKIFTAATSQPDYLRKISLKMLTMETKSQNTLANNMPPNQVGPSNKPPDQGLVLQSQVHNLGQQHSIPLPGQLQPHQQLLSQNVQNNVASQPNLPPVSSLAQTPSQNIVQNSNIQNITGPNSVGTTISQNSNLQNMFPGSQRQMPGRQQIVPPQNSQQYLYQQQFKQKLQLQSQMQQQQQNLLQPNQLQSSQQSIMQTSSVMQPSMMQASSLSSIPQNQQSTNVQQPMQSMPQQHSQVIRHQQQTAVTHQPSLPSQQQQQLMGHQPNTTNMQHAQMLGQQNNVGDIQQPQRMLSQQSNLTNLQQRQQLINQQNNPANIHQQQFGNNGPGLQQQHLLGHESGNADMQTSHHSTHMLQQPKVPMQQQSQQNTSNLLLPHSQQPQPLGSQQQLMPQIHTQSAQLQQQLGLQQQPNPSQRDMQQRIQASGSLLQQQNVLDQKKQLYQTQRTLPETSATSLDSTAQTAQPSGADWQEEVYRKLQTMKESYLPEMNEMYQKIANKLQQHDSLPQQPKSDQIDKLRAYKTMLERMMALLQIPKNNILPNFKEKLGSYEKQIINLINSNRPRKGMNSVQAGQLPPTHMSSMQQPQSQVTQVHSHENQMNPQLQSTNLQGSVPTMQQNNIASLQHNALAGVSTGQQNMMNSMQPVTNLDSGHGNSMNSLQQVPMSSLQQNPVSTPQQTNINSLPSQGGANMIQPNALQSGSSALQHQLKHQQEQQMLQSQQFKQQYQQRQQLMQRQQLLQQQQLHHPAKPQLSSQLQTHQMPQLHQMNDINDIKMRQGMGVKSGVFQQHLTSGQHSTYSHQQLKQGSAFPVSSPQLLQAASPQIQQHSSPQVDQQNHLPSKAKVTTPLQSSNSPFVGPTPSPPLAPSPMPGESEKPIPCVSSISNAANIGHQQTGGAIAPAQSLAIGTPGISASPLLAEFSAPDGAHGNALAATSGKSTVTEQPLERLINAVKSMSSKALSAAVMDIGSVVSMNDRIAGSAPGNGSRAAVGEDLVSMTNCRLQARNFITQDGSNGIKRMKRYTSAIPLNVVPSAGSMNDSIKQLTASETSDLESTATSSVKKPKIEVNHALLEEIREINHQLIDTVVDISNEDVDPTAAVAAAEGAEGIIVKCSFIAVALSPSLKSQYASAQMSPIQPLRLLVPANYPNCSPILLDKFPVESSKENDDLSVKARSKFSTSLRSLSQPMSLGEIARTWDVCARRVISEHAQQSGGGSFSSKYGTWENCLTTN
ncbi:mediator of RNA polymerase II transcription subunit 15a-like isoform X2 [Glycine soja]|uniref:mediator of RNA polymerase II transcription subunit 15a-like isoform X2 n=1 Tax=Glycine soja TaxID=3848 RepID=UPI001040C710|nr:mediator of RNA polymerase II transcription subunit 15a-like isoform X2 [Glycine soja]